MISILCANLYINVLNSHKMDFSVSDPRTRYGWLKCQGIWLTSKILGLVTNLDFLSGLNFKSNLSSWSIVKNTRGAERNWLLIKSRTDSNFFLSLIRVQFKTLKLKCDSALS